jgi:diaminopimelate epimerase
MKVRKVGRRAQMNISEMIHHGALTQGYPAFERKEISGGGEPADTFSTTESPGNEYSLPEGLIPKPLPAHSEAASLSPGRESKPDARKIVDIETSAVPPGTEIAKMDGLGNNFVILDNRAIWLKDYVGVTKSLCAQLHTDGLLVIESSDKADLRMLIYDADGTKEAMCGNGIRCFVKHVHDAGICTKKEMDIETGAGIKHTVIIKDEDEPNGFQVRVDMGEPELRRSKIPMTGPDTPTVIDETLIAGGYPYTFTAVNTGIPHTVVFTDRLPGVRLKEIGPLIENHPLFPEKTNVEFVVPESRTHVNAQVWEVGVGETQACGTGACAMVVAGNLKNILDHEATVTYPGGDLNIKWEGKGYSVIMTGPAEEVFHGVAKPVSKGPEKDRGMEWGSFSIAA